MNRLYCKAESYRLKGLHLRERGGGSCLLEGQRMKTSCKRSIEPLTSIPWAMDMATQASWSTGSCGARLIFPFGQHTCPHSRRCKELAGCQSDSGARTTCLLAWPHVGGLLPVQEGEGGAGWPSSVHKRASRIPRKEWCTPLPLSSGRDLSNTNSVFRSEATMARKIEKYTPS